MSDGNLLARDPYDAVTLPVPDGTERLPALLAWALLSPSPHNTQPWSWVIHDNTIELRGDYDRLLEVSDPDGRELVIGCGSSLEHLLLRLGIESGPIQLTVLPDDDDPHLLARVVVGTGTPYLVASDLVDAMPKRRTNRTAYSGDPMTSSQRKMLDDACAQFGVATTWVDSAQTRSELVELIMSADRDQMGSKDFRRELSHWMRPEHSRRDDGMVADLLGQHGVSAYVAPLVVRTFDVGKMQAAKDSQLTAGSPDIVVLSTDTDDSAAHLSTGRALAHVTLTAVVENLSSAYMNQPCEVPDRRAELAALVNAPHPQLVMRFGTADPVHHSARRPVSQVVTG